MMLAVIVMLAVSGVHAQGTVATKPVAKPAVEQVSAWARGNRVLLGVTQARLGFSAQWRFARADNGDIVLDKEESRAGQTEAGTLILVGSGALAARDLRLERGRELDSINGPLLMLQLVLRLMERAVPGGPASLKQDTRIELSERVNGIKVTGVGADGEFFAPWTLKGTIGPASNGQIKFEFEFVSANRAKGAPTHETSIAGIWQDAVPGVALPDNQSLRGWRVYQLKTVVKPRGTINTLGLGTSAPMAFGNLGQVRRSVAEWADEGARRSKFLCN